MVWPGVRERNMKRRGFIAGGSSVLASLLASCSKPAPAPAPPPQTAKPAPVKSVADASSRESASSSSAPPNWELIDTPENVPDLVRVSLKTTKGEIVVELDGKHAPITVNNFLRYVDSGKLDGANFWRAANAGPSGFVQASAKGPTFPPIKHESTKMTGLSNVDGALSMSRFAPGTATADFVICVGDNTFLDAGQEGSEDKLGYAAFGHVIKGMSVVRSILTGKIDKHTREGGWAGQMLAKPVDIISARRLKD